MAQNDVYSAFIDISVLTDYCCIHVDNHKSARNLLNLLHDNGGIIVIGKRSGQELTDRIINRQRLFSYLFNKASEYSKEYSDPVTQFKSDILNFTNLNEAIPGGMNMEYATEIGDLRDYLDRVGMDKFRMEIDDLQRGVHEHQVRLENTIIDDRFSRGGRDTLQIELALESISDDSAQVESLIDGLDWGKMNPKGRILVRHTDEIYQKKDELSSRLPPYIRNNLNLLSPRDALAHLREISQ